jgi:hypothetical protein
MRNVFTAIFKFIARLVAVFLALLTVIATITVLLLSSIDHTLLNPRTSKQAFVKNKVYERLPTVAAREFSLVKSLFASPCASNPETQLAKDCFSQSGNSSQPTGRLGPEGMALLNGLSSEQWETLILHLFPADELKIITESTLDETIGYFHGEGDSAQMPLVHLKARFTDKAGEGLTLLLLESQPPCSAEQQAQLKASDLNAEAAPPIFCSATGETHAQLSAELQRRLKNVSTELPDEVIIIKSPSPSIPSSFRRFFGEDRQTALQKLNMALPYAPLLPLVLLLLVALFAVRSLRGWMRWWGIPIFIAGLMTLIFGVLLFFMFDQIWTKYVLHTLPSALTSGFGEITQDVAHSLTNDLAKWFMLQAGIMTLLALGILYTSSFVKPPPDPSLPPLAQPGTPGGPVIHPPQKKRGK